ncbi:tryptophan 7-halogenase [Kutzneria sp. CA-103260]|uniref:tryptophan 7-halogenase n=1 Tax=Kutzneria sp. CA-103260 TaxID=2802641 RepID=UPI001BA6EE3B
MDSEQFDVVVIGGGPGGSTVASFVAMQGRRVLLLEKEKFPRYQIGESLLPATVLGVCGLLGVTDELARAGFVQKRGGTLLWGANPELWAFNFTDALPNADEETVSYQVERMKFDNILLNNARRVGVEVREQCTVNEVIADAERVRGVRYVDADGQRRQAMATFVVDASGNRSSTYRTVAESRQYSEFFKNVAIFGYFENGKRLPPPNSGNVLTAAFKSGWFWYIPLSDTLTSVGAVVRHDFADRVQGDRAKALQDLIAESPLISEYLENATRVTEGTYGDVRVRKDYSYCATKFWRPGMVLVGDAACFIDPVLSTGVHLATYSALLAARSINTVLAGKIDEEAAFAEFESRYRWEYGSFHEFLVSFYDTHVDESSYFWKAKKVTNYESSELEAFVRLVGGVAGERVLSGVTNGVAPSTATAPDWDAEQALRFDPQEAEGWGTTRWVPGGIGAPPGSDAYRLEPSADALHWEVRA